MKEVELYICECGRSCKKFTSSINRHFNSTKHQLFEYQKLKTKLDEQKYEGWVSEVADIKPNWDGNSFPEIE